MVDSATTAIRATAHAAEPLDAVVARASAIGVLGWVRAGKGDASVQVHAEGPRAAVEALVASLRSVEVQPAQVEGHEQFAVRGVSAGAFEVRRDGGRFALRLEVGGELRAWTVPRGPSMDPADKRLAVEGAPPQDAGATLWDRGTYEQGGRVPWPEALERGHAVFVLHGERLRGGFALQRTRPGQWLLIKRRDEWAER